jgi:hypothetical protein
MRCSLTAIAIAAATTAIACAAHAESNTIGVNLTSDRDPDKFATPKNTKYELNASHSFDSGLILAGLFVYVDDAFIPKTSEHLEGTLGYRLPFNSILSVWGSGGMGEHWRQNPDSAFPYYVVRIGADLGINNALTWNVVSFRYRDAFNADEHFNTPQLATGLTYKLDEQRSILSKLQRNWHDGSPSSTGVLLGYQQKF